MSSLTDLKQTLDWEKPWQVQVLCCVHIATYGQLEQPVQKYKLQMLPESTLNHTIQPQGTSLHGGSLSVKAETTHKDNSAYKVTASSLTMEL